LRFDHRTGTVGEVVLESTSAPIKQRYEQIADRLLAELRSGRLAPGERLPGERELALAMGVGRASVREALGWLQVRGLIETRRGAGSYVVADVAERLGQAPGGVLAGGASADGAGAGGTAGAVAPDASPSALLQARLILEPAVARLAAERAPQDPAVDELLALMAASTDAADPAARARWSDADRTFHRLVAAHAGNPVLLSLADHIAALMDEPLWRRLRDEAIADPGHTVLQLAEHRLIWAAIAEGDPDAAATHATQHIHRARRYMALD
jgi:DNA-binding FadR family transcriptional regulator